MQNKKPLCYAPFINTCIKLNKHKPCCVYNGYQKIKNEDFWSDENLQSIRKDMINQVFPEGCSNCKQKVDLGLDSDIKIYDYLVKKHFPDIEVDIVNGNQLNKPIVVDFRPSNICNLKCRMCHYSSSNLLAIEILDNDELLEFHNIDRIVTDKKVIFQSSPAVFSWIKKIKPKEIKLLGGEPSVDTRVVDLISALPTNTLFKMTTNLASLTPKFKKNLEKINLIKMRISMDGTNEFYNYIRTNGHWNKFEKNLNYILSKPNIIVNGFNIVLMPYNIFNITDTLLYITEIKKNYSIEKMTFAIVNSNDAYTSISAILPNDKKSVIDELLYYKNIDEVFENTASLISSIEFNDDDYKRFVKYNNILDNIRKTQLIELSPKFKNYI